MKTDYLKCYILCLCTLLGLTSCGDFLEEENLSDINSDEFFSQKDGYESLVNASYSTLPLWKNEPWLFCLGVDIYTRGESELISGSYGNRDVFSSELNEYNTGYTSTKDIFLFRLVDTYLMAAEAYLQTGDKAKAAERVNAVRRRAAIDGHQTEMSVTAADIDIDFILDERASEMVGEYKRWMDLKRTGKLIERTLLHNNLAARTNKMDSHILVRPIPQSVIDQSQGGFAQNPGY